MNKNYTHLNHTDKIKKGNKEEWISMQVMGRNYKGKHLKKNQLKRAKMNGKKVIGNKIAKKQ